MNSKTLQLFNAVLKQGSSDISVDYKNGLILESGATYAKSKILKFIKNKRLSGEDLNKTFHKSWSVIENSSRFELLVEQVKHYLSTYGTAFEGDVYIPDEVLDIPDVKLKFVVIKALTKDEIIDRCLGVLSSGIALKTETIDLILSLLEDLSYEFKTLDGIKNKEAIIKISDKYSVYPSDPVEFLRYIIFKSTGNTLLIKNQKVYTEIKEGRFNPSLAFEAYGLENLSTIFNRFKPIFLSYKGFCAPTINKISKLSKVHHTPMPQNPINMVTSEAIKDTSFLKGITTFTLFRALQACRVRMQGQDTFTYRVRNGRSFTKEVSNSKFDVCNENYNTILNFLKNKLPKNRSIFIPDNIDYAIPTSEKMFVGNVPTGTKISADVLNVGVYWRNEWGAYDLDLSSISATGSKVGWNSAYRSGSSIYYSGDITSAPNGAVEFLRFNELETPQLVLLNVYAGNNNSGYKIVIGDGPNVDRDHMMDPNSVVFETKCETTEQQNIVGLVQNYGDKSVFTILNFGSGGVNVSSGSDVSIMQNKALIDQWDKSLYLKDFVESIGWNIVDTPEDADIDLSIDTLDKDTFINIFE